MDYKILEQWLKKDEGFDKFPVKDTVGKLTLGYGRNIQDCGISADEAELMLKNDIKNCEQQLSGYSWYNKSPDNVKMALINMCFMGIEKLLGFKKMIKAIDEENWTIASIEAVNSEWAKQVGKRRSNEVAIMIREGL